MVNETNYLISELYSLKVKKVIAENQRIFVENRVFFLVQSQSYYLLSKK